MKVLFSLVVLLAVSTTAVAQNKIEFAPKGEANFFLEPMKPGNSLLSSAGSTFERRVITAKLTSSLPLSLWPALQYAYAHQRAKMTKKNIKSLIKDSESVNLKELRAQQKNLRKARMRKMVYGLTSVVLLAELSQFMYVSKFGTSFSTDVSLSPTLSFAKYHLGLGSNNENRMKGIAERLNNCPQLEFSEKDLADLRQALEAEQQKLTSYKQEIKKKGEITNLKSKFIGKSGFIVESTFSNSDTIAQLIESISYYQNMFPNISRDDNRKGAYKVVMDKEVGISKFLIRELDGKKLILNLTSELGQSLQRAAALKAALIAAIYYESTLESCRSSFEKINERFYNNFDRTTLSEIESLERSTTHIENSVQDIRRVMKK
jgi:hypothetical protein